MAKKPRYRARALEKGLEILEFLAPRAQAMTLSEISAGLGRSKSEIFRMLQAARRGPRPLAGNAGAQAGAVRA